jgi:hypothetical protein
MCKRADKLVHKHVRARAVLTSSPCRELSKSGINLVRFVLYRQADTSLIITQCAAKRVSVCNEN